MKSARTAAYEYKFKEVSCDAIVFEYLEGKALSLLEQRNDSVQLRELRLDLYERVLELAKIDGNLTTRQRKILFEYYLTNKTQSEVAAALGLNQVVITKAIHGQTYKSKSGVRMPKTGGILKRLGIIASKDSVCQRLLSEIANSQYNKEY